MVEQWSSKSYVWVRFLLPLLLKIKNTKHLKTSNNRFLIINFLKKKTFINRIEKNTFIKYFYNLNYTNRNKYLFIFRKNSLFKSFNNYKINNYLFHFYFLKNFFFFNFKKKDFFLNKINFFNCRKMFLITYFDFSIKLFNFYFNNFINFFLSLNSHLLGHFFNFNKLYYYYYFYQNSFFSLTAKSNFFLSFSNTGAHLKFFNNFRNNLFSSNNLFLSSYPLKNQNFNTSRLIFLKKIKNFFLSKNFSINNNFFKILKTKYLFFSKLFFFSFGYLNRNASIFKLSKYDWLSDSLARLTRDSMQFNTNDYLMFKNFPSFNLSCGKFLFLNNFINNNDFFFESNYFFLNYNYKNFKTKQYSFFNKYKFKVDVFSLFLETNTISKLKNAHTYLELKKSKASFFNSFSNFNILKNNNIAGFNYFNLFYNFNRFEALCLFFFKPLFFKYIYLLNNNFKLTPLSSFNNLNLFFNNNFFYSKNTNFFNNNLIPDYSFSYILKKKMLKVFNYSKFPTITSIWHYNSLTRFLEFISGKKVYIKFNTFLNNFLDFSEKAQCLLWAQKVKYFRKVLGPRLFLNESLQIIYLSLKLKDPFILSNWIVSTMQKISFWKYKTFLRYIKYVLRYFFWVIFRQLNIKGVKFQLKGKISVAGNARTRTVFHNVGFTSHTTFNNKILYKLNLVRTFTGVLGLKLWIVF